MHVVLWQDWMFAIGYVWQLVHAYLINCRYLILWFINTLNFSLHRSSLPSPYSLLHCSAVWSRQCDPHSAVAAPTVWWWGSSQLHHHCQSRPQSSHHQWNKCSSHCTLQCDTHCQYCGHQLQWEQQYCYGDHTSHRYIAVTCIEIIIEQLL